ncbi:YqzK family protein [Bacillus tianshenii]|nr:YqzK family protein [Bacillus tianshenii]
MLTGMKMFFHALKVFIIFTGCTILFYIGMMWVNEEYQNYHRYDEPQGNAVKVSSNFDDAYPVIERLLFFYEHGE